MPDMFDFGGGISMDPMSGHLHTSVGSGLSIDLQDGSLGVKVGGMIIDTNVGDSGARNNSGSVSDTFKDSGPRRVLSTRSARTSNASSTTDPTPSKGWFGRFLDKIGL